MRVAGFGFDPHFFKRATIRGKDFYEANTEFGLRFFPRSQVRFPEMVSMPAVKAPETCRIFIFGESAALGDPRPNYAASRYLEVLLAERFPQTKFEIINTGVTAINSHVIVPIACECARHQGDLWLIYMGNNEMVGPFGAATVFGLRAPPLWLVRTEIQLQRLRLSQLLLEISQKLRKSDSSSAGWRGMEMFVQNQLLPGDPRRQKVYDNFERNLQDIVNAGLGCGAKIILSTVAVNLKDCPPFGSEPRQTNRSNFDKLCQDGTAAETLGEFAVGQADFQQAVGVYPNSAEAHFQLGTCLLRQTNATAALPQFQRAVDTDTLPFRADSRINVIIRMAARQFAGESVALCDAAEALGAESPQGITGDDLLYEHVHFNPNGNYALALLWAEEVKKTLEPGRKDGGQASWPSQTQCEQLLGLTDWNRISILEDVLRRMQRPPFSGQSGNAQRVARLEHEIIMVRQRLTDAGAGPAQEVYLRALRRAPEDFRLHANYAEFLEARREWKAAVSERKAVCELCADYYFPYYTLGVDLKESGALGEAREALLKAAGIKPDEGDVRLELGTVCARQGDWEQALEELQAARQFSPGDNKVLLFLGEVLWKLGRHDEALASLREAIRLTPSDWQPHYRLASDLSQNGNFSEAATEYEEALRLEPANSKAKLGLATALLNLGHRVEALKQLDSVLQMEPTNRTALEIRDKIRGIGLP